jgi:hypothetical protein
MARDNQPEPREGELRVENRQAGEALGTVLQPARRLGAAAGLIAEDVSEDGAGIHAFALDRQQPYIVSRLRPQCARACLTEWPRRILTSSTGTR